MMRDIYDDTKPDTAQLEAARAEIIAFGEQHRTLGTAALAIAFIEQRGSATSAELSLLLDLGPDRYPSVELRSSVQGERLVCKDRVWTLGPRAVPETREQKPDALESGVEPGKQEPKPVEAPRFLENGAGQPLKDLKHALREPAPKPSRCRFAVWSDGEVEIVAGIGGVKLSREEFDELVQFVAKERT
jgi:hypothetical protein